MAKRKKRAPAIVPKFLKQMVTVGAIPALAAGCHPGPRTPPPVVAYFAPPEPQPAPPKDAAQPVQQVQPVVAAYQPDLVVPPAVVAAYHQNTPVLTPDAGIDAPPAPKPPAKRTKAAAPPPRLEPPVVAAYQVPPVLPVKKP